VAGLGLEQAGVRYDTKVGITIDAYLRTSVPHIFACGDVTGPYRFTHAAGFQAAVAVRNALFPWLKTNAQLEPMPWTTFTDPEVARVGQTEAEARRAHGKVLVLRATFAHTDRAHAEGQTDGFVKLIVTPWRGRILGGHIVGPQAGELIQEVTLAMRRGLNVRALADTIHVYPTLAMAVQQAALGFYTQWPLYTLARRPLRALVHRAR
jgi:pyruvate/2-oxoglutarate dehydrogenase complex dihydrolipoamide dehydrogenase (E3) component